VKYGYFVGYTEDHGQGKIVGNNEPMMMEDFMQQYGIQNSEDFVWLQETATLEYAQQFKKSLVNCCLIYLHGSADPRVCSAARNTGLFGFHGPAMGDIGGKMNLKLRDFIAYLKPDLLPKLPELPSNGKVCVDCGRSFPEPDGFRGVVGLDKKLRCFECYLKHEGGNCIE